MKYHSVHERMVTSLLINRNTETSGSIIVEVLGLLADVLVIVNPSVLVFLLLLQCLLPFFLIIFPYFYPFSHWRHITCFICHVE